MNWTEYVRRVIPYTPGEQPNEKNMIKLNTNECPYPPAPEVEKLIHEFPSDSLRLYPDPTIGKLTRALAEYHEVEPEQIFIGVGSDDVLALAFLTFFNSERPILFPDITYSFYDVWAGVYRIAYETVPLDDEFSIRAKDYKRENGGIIIANPNAPTGKEESVEVIEEILQANPKVVVIVDEAYVDFGGSTVLGLLKRYDNLLIVRTFSKSRSMAGMRIGYAVGSEAMIKYMMDVKYSINSYTLNTPSILWGTASVKDNKYFVETVQKVIDTRERIKKELKDLGFSFQDSKANFIFATHESLEAKFLFEKLKEDKIYVRYFNKPRINNYLRISIGTDQEMDQLIERLRLIIQNQ